MGTTTATALESPLAQRRILLLSTASTTIEPPLRFPPPPQALPPLRLPAHPLEPLPITPLPKALIDPATGEIIRVVDIAEAPWRVVGILLLPLIAASSAISEVFAAALAAANERDERRPEASYAPGAGAPGTPRGTPSSIAPATLRREGAARNGRAAVAAGGLAGVAGAGGTVAAVSIDQPQLGD